MIGDDSKGKINLFKEALARASEEVGVMDLEHSTPGEMLSGIISTFSRVKLTYMDSKRYLKSELRGSDFDEWD